MRRLLAAVPLALLALACAGESAPADVANGAAAAGCEAASAASLEVGPEMLPGRRCLLCHMSGASASDEPLSAGGTVFASAKPSSCDAGGVSGAVVELLKADGTVAAATTTNAAGNFAFRQSLAFPLKARVTANGKTTMMPGNVTTGDCATCHDGTSAPRINVE
ncbi:MAG: hypothetical protein RL199_1272 [Pseudomonadota bacterium]|jgi:hypothetical protein